MQFGILKQTRVALFSRLVVAVALVALAPLSAVMAQIDPATRPPTQDLLPETTVLFVQIDNFKDLMSKMQESSMGQLMQDEDIAPLVNGLWDEAKTAYDDVKDQVGLSIEDLEALPSGEMTFAIIAPRRQNPEFMMILELNDESEALDRVLDRGRDVISNDIGSEITKEESDDGIEFESFTVDGKKVKFFRKDGLIVGSTSEEELDAFIDRWMEREVEKVRPLTANRKFVTIMNRCVGANDLKPEARFFVDPIALAKSATRGNFAAQAGLNFLPVLGLDGLLGMGGSMLLSEDEFESITHAHLLLANPRSGVFEMLSFKPTTYEPEPWLPADTTTYMTTSWDIDQMVSELTKMIEAFQGEEGMVDQWLEDNINQELDLDVKEDILAHLSGRVTWIQWMEPPITFNSQVNLLAFELSDPEAFETTLEKIVARINRDADEDNPENVVSSDYKGVRIWSQSPEDLENQRESFRQLADDGRMPEMKVPEPAFALVGKYLLVSPQSRKLVEHAIDTDQGDETPLVNDEKYRSVADKMARMLKTDMPVAMMYSNPEESIRMIFELIKSDNTQSFMSNQAEGNKYVAGFKKRFDDNPLPDFDKIRKYFRPTGGYATSDDTGYHFLGFTLRDNPDGEKE